MLHCIIKPTTIAVEKKQNSKIHKKYSIADSQQSFLKIFKEPSDVQEFFANNKEHTQPFVFAFGESIYDIEKAEFYVYCDNIKYKFNNFLRAFESCFKLYHIFNLTYPKESFNFWTFVQVFFFNINLKCDKKNATVKTTISMLNRNI